MTTDRERGVSILPLRRYDVMLVYSSEAEKQKAAFVSTVFVCLCAGVGKLSMKRLLIWALMARRKCMSEMSLLQGLNCMPNNCSWRKMCIKEVSSLERCPHFRGVCGDGFHCLSPPSLL